MGCKGPRNDPFGSFLDSAQLDGQSGLMFFFGSSIHHEGPDITAVKVLDALLRADATAVTFILYSKNINL